MGLSDFKFKGWLITSTSVFLKEKIGEDYVQNSLIGYFKEQEIKSNVWYPVYPAIQWLYDSAVKSNISFGELVRNNSRFVTATEISDVGRFFMKLSGPRRIFDAIPQICNSNFNWIQINNLENKKGCYRDEVVLPERFCEFYLFSLEGVIDVLLSICGKSVREFNIDKRQKFMKDEIEYIRISYTVSYS